MDYFAKLFLKEGNCMARALKEEEFVFIVKNFRKIEDALNSGGHSLKEEYRSLNWEIVYFEENDEKYGRFAICEDEKIYRKLTFGEFYGSGVVD